MNAVKLASQKAKMIREQMAQELNSLDQFMRQSANTDFFNSAFRQVEAETLARTFSASLTTAKVRNLETVVNKDYEDLLAACSNMRGLIDQSGTTTKAIAQHANGCMRNIFGSQESSA
jgi:hypothetical protein